MTSVIDKQLVGCGPNYADDVLWHLDIADGVRDGFATRATRGRGAVVYVVDTGVESQHDEMMRDDGTSRVIAGLDPAIELSTKPVPTSGPCAGDSAIHPCFDVASIGFMTHGTAVASIVAGRNSGVAPDAQIVSVRWQSRVSSWPPTVTDVDLFIRALDDIVVHAFRPDAPPFRTAIVNMSGFPAVLSDGSSPRWPEFERKVRLMVDGVDAGFNPDPNGKRFFFTIAAGNNIGTSALHPELLGECRRNDDVAYLLPSLGPSIDGLMTVGGAARDGKFWSGSCGGNAVEILAPAEAMLVASITAHDRYRGTINGFDFSSGTSYAAPYVAGIAARLLETDPTLTPAQLEQRIKLTPFNGIAMLNERPSASHHRAAPH